MKIFFIINSLETGGKERQFIELVNGLENQRAFEIKVALLNNTKNSYSLAQNAIIINRQKKRHLYPFVKIASIYYSFKPDIIHTWDNISTLYSLPIKLISPKTKFINGAIRTTRLNNPSSIFSLSLKRFNFIFSDYIIANSYSGLYSFKAPIKKSFVIYNGINPTRINNLVDEAIIKQKFNIKYPIIIGMVANFLHYKDYDTFFCAAKCVLKKRRDVVFLAIGDGPDFEKYKKIVSDYQDNIKLLGYQKDVESIVNIFSIGVLTSLIEGLSNSILEYMMLKKPVIATNVGGNPEIIVDKKTGYIINTRSPHELEKQLIHLISNKSLAERMGHEGYRRVCNLFNNNYMTNEYVKLYRRLKSK